MGLTSRITFHGTVSGSRPFLSTGLILVILLGFVHFKSADARMCKCEAAGGAPCMASTTTMKTTTSPSTTPSATNASVTVGAPTNTTLGTGRKRRDADGDPAPADGDAAPADGDAAPAGGDAAPAGGDAAPAGGDAAPAGGDAAPAGGDAAPAGGDPAPADGDHAPADEDHGRADAEARAPVEFLECEMRACVTIIMKGATPSIVSKGCDMVGLTQNCTTHPNTGYLHVMCKEEKCNKDTTAAMGVEWCPDEASNVSTTTAGSGPTPGPDSGPDDSSGSQIFSSTQNIVVLFAFIVYSMIKSQQ